MALPVLDVTARDYDSLYDTLTQRAVQRFPKLPQTDFNASNFFVVTIDLFAGVGDSLNFYLDNQAQDMFWGTVRDRENAIRLGALIGYRLPGASAAIATLRFQINLPALGDVIIPARTVVKTNDPDFPIAFQTISTATITAGSLFIDVSAENAALFVEEYISDGQADQVFRVDEIPYIEASAAVKVNGTPWAIQDDFFNSKTTDQHFIIELDGEDRLSVVFGDGNNGAIPPDGATIEITYKTGGGAQGSVFTDTIKVLESTFTDVFSNQVNMSVTNIEAAVSGVDRQSVAEARFRAPRSVKTNERTIAEEDFEINASEVAGVSRARVFTSDNNALIAENTGFLYLVPKGGGTPPTSLRDAVYDYLTKTKPVPVGFVLNVVSPTYISISFVMKVFVKDSSFKTTVLEALNAAFSNFFSETVAVGDEAGQPNLLMDFERKFFNSEIIAIGQDSHAQIRNVVLVTDVQTTYTLLPEQFPVKGVLQFQDGDTGLPLE